MPSPGPVMAIRSLCASRTILIQAGKSEVATTSGVAVCGIATYPCGMTGRPPSVDPTATGSSLSTDGDVAPPSFPAQGASKPRRPISVSLEDVSKKLELTRKIAISLALIVLICGGFLLLAREIVRDRLLIDPVAVLVDDPKGGL